MRIKIFEIVAIAFFLMFLVSVRFSDREPPSEFSLVIRFFLFLIYAGTGYFIFQPKQKLKAGAAIAITLGIVTGLMSYFIVQSILIAVFFGSFYWTVFVIAAICLIIPLIILYFVNRCVAENKIYVRRVAVRALIPPLLFFTILILPNKARVLTFYSTESWKYYSLIQDELIDEAYDNAFNENSVAVDKAKESIKYSRMREDTTGYRYQRSLLALGFSYYASGEYFKADSVLNQVLELTKNGWDVFGFDSGAERDRAIHYLGLNYSYWGNYKRSDSLLNISLQNYNDAETAAFIYRRLANNANRRGKLEKADELFRISLSKHKECGYSDPSDYIFTLLNMGDNFMDMGSYSSADSVFNIALTSAQKEYKGPVVEIASVYDCMATLNKTLAKFQKAKEYCQKSLDIKKVVYGIEGQHYLESAIQLVSIKQDLSEYDDTESELLRILGAIESKHNPNGSLASNCYDKLAFLYKDFGNFQNAKFYSGKSLDARKYWFGDFKLPTAVSMDGSAYIFYWEGSYGKADSLYHRALRIKDYFAGSESAEYARSLNGLGLVYTAQLELKKADSVFNVSQTIIENDLGKNHPDYAITLNNVAHLRIIQGNYVLAENLFREALGLNKTLYGENHIDIAMNYSGLGDLYAAQKSKQLAENNYKNAIAVYQKLFKFRHPAIAQIEKKISYLN